MPKDINVHLSPPMTLSQIAAKTGLSIDATVEVMIKLASRGLLKLVDEERQLYRVSYLTKE